MSRPAQASGRRRFGRAMAPLLLVISAGGFMPAQASGQGQPAAIGGVQGQAPRRHQAHGVEHRVRVLTKALGLDARQQLELKKILLGQREQVMKAWSDPSAAPASRVAATEAIGDRTAGQIRALLNDEQRTRYGAPRPANQAAGPGASVESWMHKG
jgi:hypothetical protein